MEPINARRLIHQHAGVSTGFPLPLVLPTPSSMARPARTRFRDGNQPPLGPRQNQFAAGPLRKGGRQCQAADIDPP